MICHLTSVHKVLDTRIFYKECVSLAQAGYKVTLVAPHRGARFQLEGVDIKPIPQYRSRLLRFLITDTVLFFRALGTRASVYHIHDPELLPAALMLRLLGKKVVYDMHEDVGADLKEKKWLFLPGLAARAYHFFERATRCRLILAEDSYADRLKRKNTGFSIVRNFPRLERLQSMAATDRAGKDVLLMVGTLGARRGLPYVLDALAKLHRQGMKLRLRCIGEVTPGVNEILNSTLAYKEIRGFVEFTGFLPVEEAYQQSADCLAGLALPEDLPNHRQSYPTKMFEYMAVGLPVIASDFPLYKSVVEKNGVGFCVSPSDPEAIANTIAELYRNPSQVNELSTNALNASAKYSWQEEERKLLALYEEMVKL